MTSTPIVENELAIGHYLTLRIPPDAAFEGLPTERAIDNYSELRFQNFWIGQNAVWVADEPGAPDRVHSFMPFGFSGITTSRQGDNGSSTLTFPNNEVSRSFLDTAVKQEWTAVLRVCLVENLTDPNQSPQQLYKYVGQVSGGSWTVTTLTVTLDSVLDAVTAQIPKRGLLQSHVGFVPISGTLRI